MTSLLVTALVSAIPVLGIMGIMSLRHQRLDRFKDFPQPKTSVVWGHMALLAEEMKKALKDAQFGRFRRVARCITPSLSGLERAFRCTSMNIVALSRHMTSWGAF